MPPEPALTCAPQRRCRARKKSDIEAITDLNEALLRTDRPPEQRWRQSSASTPADAQVDGRTVEAPEYMTSTYQGRPMWIQRTPTAAVQVTGRYMNRIIECTSLAACRAHSVVQQATCGCPESKSLKPCCTYSVTTQLISSSLTCTAGMGHMHRANLSCVVSPWLQVVCQM
jgi:hypothetical protein